MIVRMVKRFSTFYYILLKMIENIKRYLARDVRYQAHQVRRTPKTRTRPGHEMNAFCRRVKSSTPQGLDFHNILFLIDDDFPGLCSGLFSW